MKSVRPVIASNGVLSLQVRSVGSQGTSGRDKEKYGPVVHGAMGCGQKNFQLVWRCHQLLSGFLAKGHLPRVSRQSSRSLMIRVIMK